MDWLRSEESCSFSGGKWYPIYWPILLPLHIWRISDVFMDHSWEKTFVLTKCVDEISCVASSAMDSAMEMSFTADREQEGKWIYGCSCSSRLEVLWAGLVHTVRGAAEEVLLSPETWQKYKIWSSILFHLEDIAGAGCCWRHVLREVLVSEKSEVCSKGAGHLCSALQLFISAY